MKQLSLDNLRAFVTVVDMGGYAKAGDHLGRSQPAVSLQIKRLEEQLGRKFFKKHGQRQVINNDGEQLYQYAQRLLQLNDEVFRHFNQAQLTGQLRLGLPSEFATRLLPEIIGDFNQAWPEVTLEVSCDLSKNLLQSDKKAQFDLILALDDSTAPNLLEDELVWVSNKNFQLESGKLALVVAPEGCIYRRRAIQTLQDSELGYRISYTNADIGGITAALNAGLGLTVLAKSTLPKELSIVKDKRLPELGKVGIHLLNQAKKHPQAGLKLAEFIQQRLSLTH